MTAFDGKPPPMEREEYIKRWFDARDAVFPIALRLTEILIAALIGVSVWLGGVVVLVPWAIGAFVVGVVIAWLVTLYAHCRGADARQWPTIWDMHYHEPWRLVPRREAEK